MEPLDYMAPLWTVPVNVTKTKRPDTQLGPTLVKAELYHIDDLIITRIFGLDTLHHENCCRASTGDHLREIEGKYHLNKNNKAMLEMGQDFFDPTYDYVPTDEKKQRVGSDIDLDWEEEADPMLPIEGIEAGGEDEMVDRTWKFSTLPFSYIRDCVALGTMLNF